MEQQEFTEVVKILGSKKPSHADIKFLFDKYRHILFLKELLDQGKKSIVFDLLSSLRYHTLAQNEVVFYAGERSSKFYLLIRGQVKVLIADPAAEPAECPLPGFFEKNQNDKRLFPSKDNQWEFKVVATLGEGQTFGELGILHDKPRMATVVAAEPTIFGVINSDDFKRVLEPTMMAESEEKLRSLRPLLEYECSYEEYWRLAAYFHKVPLLKYHTLFEEGAPFNKVYFVSSGMVQLEKMVKFSDYQEAEEGRGLPAVDGRSRDARGLGASDSLDRQNLDFKDVLRRSKATKTNSQPLVVFGQNQFLGFKELMEGHGRFCSSARVVEAGTAYSIDVENIKKCFSEFASFKKAFYSLSGVILEQLNVG